MTPPLVLLRALSCSGNADVSPEALADSAGASAPTLQAPNPGRSSSEVFGIRWAVPMTPPRTRGLSSRLEELDLLGVGATATGSELTVCGLTMYSVVLREDLPMVPLGEDERDGDAML
mmetsp:Transcript_70582/g.178883  ORF Transcript_70582/g.178883 Transcript_70582/m.178883 type:complete len:118 (+) Transcript_70582:178-531(+)